MPSYYTVAKLQRMRRGAVFPCCVILLVTMMVWQQIAGHGTEKHVSDILKAKIEIAKELWAELLQALDDDNDEKIEKREYVAAAERRFAALWSQFDDDGDGNYTRGEWEDIYLQEAFDPDCSRSSAANRLIGEVVQFIKTLLRHYAKQALTPR